MRRTAVSTPVAAKGAAGGARWKGLLRIGLYLLAAAAALILVAIVRPHTGDGLIHQIGKNCALVAFAILALQVILAARLKWIERPFGMDMILRFHKAMAVVALAFLLPHFTFVAWGSHRWRIIGGLDVAWPVWLGRLAFLVVVMNAIASLWRVKLRVGFERWRFLHNASGMVILCFGFVHSYKIGGDLAAYPMRIFWAAGFAVTATVYIFHKLVRPARLRRNQYTVAEVRREAPKVWTIYLEPPAGKEVFSYAPGQFHYITFRRGRGLPEEEHHWTISSAPTRPGLASTIKESGDFTSTIGLTRPGDKAEVSGPYGRFSYIVYPEENDLLFLCGGIGVTPFLGMLRHMHDAGVRKRILLLWSNKTEQDIVARAELEQIALSGVPRLQIAHFLTNPGPGWKGERGRINRDSIARYVAPEDAARRGVYLCCPQAMFRDLVRALTAMGVSGDRIHYEGFAL